MNSRRTTPRSSKFSDLKGLGRRSGEEPSIPPAASPLVVDTRPTVRNFSRKQDNESFMEDADVKISRHRYAKIVAQMAERARRCNSVGVFVESMLRELRLQDVDEATLAAAATWALNLLSSQSVGGALPAILEALLPVIYCQYDQEKLSYPPPAIQVQLRQDDAVQYNPYFTHSMFVEQVRVDHSKVSHLSEAVHNALKANENRRDYVLRTIDENRIRVLRTTLKMWRSHVRRLRILAVTSENRLRRHTAENSNLRLQASFYHWKVLLELSRNNFLTERLHEAAFQLENAKNQFQLQCYRADRLIQTTKKAKEELQLALEENDDLHHQVACLKEELVRREKEYNEKLSKNVSSAFKLVDRYRFFIAILVQSRFPVEPFLEAEAIALQTSGVDPAACSITDASHTSNPSRTSNPSADEEHTPGGAVEVLLRWCNHILAEATGPKNFVEVKSFGVDFATGEAFLAVLNHVHPELATIAPEEVNAEYRHRRIKDMCEKIGLLYSLDASDFIHRREDRIVMALSELFLNHISSKWQRCAAAASESMEHFQMTSTSRLEQEAEKGPLEVDEETFNSHMEDCISHLNDMEKEVATQTFYEKEITSNAISVALQERHLAVERRRGAPIPVVGRESSKPFWKLKNKHLSDLKEKVSKSDIDLWEPLINVSLPRALQQHVDTTSRLYSHYAGVNSKHMTEVGFWRFIDTTNAINDRLNKETVSTVFDRVASPQLELALKAASHGKSALDIQTLLRAARQEIDIRHISPSQFTEILVRLAINSYGAFQGMVGSVERYLEELKVSSPNDMPAMLQAFYEADCHAVTHFFCDDLSRVFFFYAKRQENSKNARERNIAMQDGGRFASLLSTRTLNYLLDDCGFISDTKEAVTLVMNNGPQPGRHFVSGDQLEQIVTVLQQRHSSMKVGEVPFTIFLESLAAISHYWCPDPLVPQSRKFAAFLCDMIRQLSIRHSNSTLLLGIPPNVTLEGGSKVDLVTS